MKIELCDAGEESGPDVMLPGLLNRTLRVQHKA